MFVRKVQIGERLSVNAAILATIMFAIAVCLAMVPALDLNASAVTQDEFILETAGAVAIVCLWWVLFSSLRQQTEEGEKLVEEIRSRFLSQNSVNQELQHLAVSFDRLCSEQVALQGIDSAVGQLEELTKQIAAAKTDFWSALHLAKHLGFHVKEKAGDYVT